MRVACTGQEREVVHDNELVCLTFWWREQALLDTQALEQERGRLRAANAALRAKLTQLLNSARITPAALAGRRNGLLTVTSW